MYTQACEKNTRRPPLFEEGRLDSILQTPLFSLLDGSNTNSAQLHCDFPLGIVLSLKTKRLKNGKRRIEMRKKKHRRK